MPKFCTMHNEMQGKVSMEDEHLLMVYKFCNTERMKNGNGFMKVMV